MLVCSIPSTFLYPLLTIPTQATGNRNYPEFVETFNSIEIKLASERGAK